MDKPATHYFQVGLTCTGMNADTVNFKMPAWTPGYYWIEDFAKNVVGFSAEDGEGKALLWKKTAKNIWQVLSGKSEIIQIHYNVYAFEQSVASPYLDNSHAYISPAGLFMYVSGLIQHPVQVVIKPYHEWSAISTGLDEMEGQPDTYYAPDFDVLYDCPVYIGNQEVWPFVVKGIPHYICVENPGSFNREKMVKDTKRIVEAASGIIGEIPYKHYTFIIMGDGRGGLEHQNSMAVFSSKTAYNPNDTSGYKRWLSFLSHEFFHVYNIKAIRPVALGPFDYDRENYTSMLWMSEGFTVYYEYLVLNRAGILNRKECLDQIRNCITAYENIPGHLFQSAAESSFDTWIQFFNRSSNSSNTTISYYDKGCAIGFLLDLAIRNNTNNEKSLDDVMRTLYQEYYKNKKRGFTDTEFRKTCETIARCLLPEIFDTYVSTTKEIDYAKYLNYAGLEISLTPGAQVIGYLGAKLGSINIKPVIRSVEWNSPAWQAGLSPEDTITEAKGIKIDLPELNRILRNSKPMDKLKLLVSNSAGKKEVTLIIGKKEERSFIITPKKNPSALQSLILNDLLKN